MREAAAREVMMVRAIERTDAARTLWTDPGRAWASSAASEVVTAAASQESFLVRRAAFAAERLSGQYPAVSATLRAFNWRGWITPLVLAIALVCGVAIDQIGASGEINILAPPVLGLLAWNIVVYVLLIARRLTHRPEPGANADGPIRGFLSRTLGRRVNDVIARHADRDHVREDHETRADTANTISPSPARANKAILAASLASFAADWSRVVAPLYAARAARILHLAAATLAVGVIAGLYVRGLAFEYRASWQSTFLNAPQIHQLLSMVLAPGAKVTGLPLPSVAHIASIRSGVTASGENAASWVHLYAATVTLVVIVPRVLFALVAWLAERRQTRNIPLPLDDPYFRRLERAFREGPVRVRVVPYSFGLAGSAVHNLESIINRAFGRGEIQISSPIAYGAEDTLSADLVSAQTDAVIALFNAAATPEAETHGAFLAALKALLPGEHGVIAMIDESAFIARWPQDDARREQRRSSWRALAAFSRVPVVFVHLAHPDLAAAESALIAAMER